MHTRLYIHLMLQSNNSISTTRALRSLMGQLVYRRRIILWSCCMDCVWVAAACGHGLLSGRELNLWLSLKSITSSSCFFISVDPAMCSHQPRAWTGQHPHFPDCPGTVAEVEHTQEGPQESCCCQLWPPLHFFVLSNCCPTELHSKLLVL